MIVRASGDEAIVARLRSELAASGLEVGELDAGAARSNGSLSQFAAERAASAALRVRSEDDEHRAVELWTASDDVAGTLDVIQVPEGEPQSAEVLALRVVETLRARLLGASAARPPPAPRELAPAPTPAPDGPAPSDDADSDTPAPPEPDRPRALWLELAPSLVMGSGGLDPQLAALLALRLDATRLISIGVFGIAPLWRGELTAEEGRANVSTWLLGAAIDAQLRWQAWTLSAGAGLASVLTHMSGSGQPPFEGDDELITSAAPLLRAGLHVELAPWLQIVARGLVGLSTPEVTVRFDQRDVARWGEPFALVSIGAELALAQP